MKEHGTDRPITKKQVSDLCAGVTGEILSFVQNLNFEQAKWLFSHKAQLANAIRDAIRAMAGNFGDSPDYLIWWQNFYREEGIEIDFRTFEIPEKPYGDWWLILVAHGMTYNKVIQALRKKLEAWLYTKDLDAAINPNKEQRRAIYKPYAIWVQAKPEADLKLTNKSASDFGDMPGVTLLERLLLEVFYYCFVATGKHLDLQNITLCLGSRYNDGNVPGVNFCSSGDEVDIGDYRPEGRHENVHSRQVVF
ncbi:MAG: hypothetical protein ABSF52_02645 [Syntrophobacteraceae bacterium]|jgi:hypothetical protein